MLKDLVTSRSLTLARYSSIMNVSFYPSIELDKKSNEGLDLLGFYNQQLNYQDP